MTDPERIIHPDNATESVGLAERMVNETVEYTDLQTAQLQQEGATPEEKLELDALADKLAAVGASATSAAQRIREADIQVIEPEAFDEEAVYGKVLTYLGERVSQGDMFTDEQIQAHLERQGYDIPVARVRSLLSGWKRDLTIDLKESGLNVAVERLSPKQHGVPAGTFALAEDYRPAARRAAPRPVEATAEKPVTRPEPWPVVHVAPSTAAAPARPRPVAPNPEDVRASEQDFQRMLARAAFNTVIQNPNLHASRHRQMLGAQMQAELGRELAPGELERSFMDAVALHGLRKYSAGGKVHYAVGGAEAAAATESTEAVTKPEEERLSETEELIAQQILQALSKYSANNFLQGVVNKRIREQVMADHPELGNIKITRINRVVNMLKEAGIVQTAQAKQKMGGTLSRIHAVNGDMQNMIADSTQHAAMLEAVRRGEPFAPRQ